METTAIAERPGPPGRPPLADLRVVEVANGVAGAFCARLLAVLGANVIKVEPPCTGDVTRAWGPFWADVPGQDNSLLFLDLNLNKRGITLDVRQAQGKALLQQLVSQVDVLLLADETPRFSDDDIESLRQANPSLIVALVRPFGTSGPYRDYRAEGLNLFQGGGSGYLIPAGPAYEMYPDRQPLDLPGHTSEKYCGLVAALAVLAAWQAVETSGGQVLDCSKQEAHLSASRQQIAWYANDALLETRASYHVAFAGCLPCKDGYVELYILSNENWQDVVRMMGRPEWALHEKFSDVVGGGPGRSHPFAHEIQEGLIAWTVNLTKREIYRLAQQHGVPLGYFATPAEFASSNHEHARSFFVTAHHPTAPLPYPVACYQLSDGEPAITHTAPRLGEHNGEVYGTHLGLTSAELTTLARQGVI